MSTLTLSPRVTRQTPERTNDEQRRRIAELLSRDYARMYPEEPPFLPQQGERVLFNAAPDDWLVAFAVWDDAKALGWARLTANRTQNPHWAGLWMAADPSLAPEETEQVYQALWSAARSEAQAQGVTVVGASGMSRLPDYEQFLTRAGFRQTLSTAEYRLELNRVNAEQLRVWQTRPENDPYRLHRWERIPEEYLERMASLMEVINDMPRGDSERGERRATPQRIRDKEQLLAAQGERRFTVAAEDTETRELVGYTEVYWGPERPELAMQGATGIRRERRGEALGKWLKAAMLEWLPVATPGAKTIITNVAGVNDAMNGLNRALGFLPYTGKTEWETRI